MVVPRKAGGPDGSTKYEAQPRTAPAKRPLPSQNPRGNERHPGDTAQEVACLRQAGLRRQAPKGHANTARIMNPTVG